MLVNPSNIEDAKDDKPVKMQRITFDIFGDNQIKINKNFIINFTKETSKIPDREAKRNCKILQFSTDWNFDEIQAEITALKSEDYPYLFIFVIEANNFEFCGGNQEENDLKIDKIKEKLHNFSKNRPYVLQLTSQNVTKIFYKEQNSDDFAEVYQPEHEILEEIENFSSFLCSFFFRLYDDFKKEMLYICCATDLQNFSIILRYLRILEIGEDFYEAVIYDKIAVNGTKADLLDALDAPFENEGRELSIEAQKCLSAGINENGLLENVITTAIENKNREIIEYLMTYWTHLLQQLPLKHQIFASTTAFKKKQFDVLCDLLEIADFPFPNKFNIKMVRHERLQKIVNVRTAFKAAIEEENFEKIDEFINNNLGFKFLYNPDNNTALKQAVNKKKFGVFYYLKSLGFQGEDCAKILNELTQEEKNQALQQAYKQRKMNVNKALPHAHNSILLLFTRSKIHNKRISKEEEDDYRNKIKKWLEDIHKIAPVMIDVAASCENLKIIFDFESKSTENVAFKPSTVLGTTYPSSKWIFIGAKLSDYKREQEIKGILAHELCHYVMCQVYDNKEHPYHKNDTNLKEEFETIVQAINKWPSKDTILDDECNGIISDVFRCYVPENFHPELIVRAVHILAEFDNDEKHSKKLSKEQYKILFDYWRNHVIPEMLKFLQKHQETIRLNRNIGLLSRISKEKIEFSSSRDIKSLIENKLTIVRTNVPKFLLINIHKYILGEFGDLYDTKNLFIEPEELCKPQINEDFYQVCEQNEDLNIFVDCTKKIVDWISNISVSNIPRFIFLVSDESQFKKLNAIFNEKQIKNTTQVEINYNWSDLLVKSQKFLLQISKITFQDYSDISLLDIFKKVVNPQEPTTSRTAEEEEEEILRDFSEIIDTQTLNLLMDGSQISINQIDKNLEEKNFDLLYQQRLVVKVQKNIKPLKIPQKSLLEDVKGMKYVLLSDMAGNGKSWTMKYFAKALRENNLTKLVVFVDLKQYIEIFKAQKVNFLTFIIQKVMKFQTKFEEKIFTKLYKKGKIFVFFDGFDEIAPDCAEFVLNLAKLFEFNGGNQLLIATRDYFQVNLQEKLQLDIVYKLDEFSSWNGIDFIARSWFLKDLEGKNQDIPVNNFKMYFGKFPKYKQYEDIAREIVQKIKMESERSIGLPQIFKMIAQSFEDEKKRVFDLTESQIYKIFVERLYNRWLREKGTLREQANTDNMKNSLTFWHFHTFHAIKSMFTNKCAKKIFPNCDGNEWETTEVIQFGLMNIEKNGEYYFLHETFREYFVADLIFQKISEEKEPESYIIELFIEILTDRKYRVIRVFLNDAIKDHPTLPKFEQKFKENSQILYKEVSFMSESKEIFEKNLEHLMKFVIIALNDSLRDEYFKDVDLLKYLIISQCVFHKIIGSTLKIEDFQEFVANVEAKTERNFVTKMLVSKCEDSYEEKRRNIFDYLYLCPNLSSHKIQKFLKFIKNYDLVIDMFEEMKECKFGTILESCISSENTKNFKILWEEIKNFSETESLPKIFKNLVKHKNLGGKSLLYHAFSNCDKVEFHNTFWELLFQLFENREELKDFILEYDDDGKNFIHSLVKESHSDLIISTFKILETKLSVNQFKGIIESNTCYGMNLLHSAACSKDVKVNEFMWEFFQNYYYLDGDFLKLLKEVSVDGNSILLYAASSSTKEVFEFMIKKLKEIAPNDIKEMIGSTNAFGYNILQIAAFMNDHLQLHECLWDTFSEYFEPKEILKFIKHVNLKKQNLRDIANGEKIKKESLELVRDKINFYESNFRQDL